MAGKVPNVIWLEGSFVETIKGWQSAWFYITEPRDAKWVAKWVAAPAFCSPPPPQLTSWINKGPDRGPVNDVPILQSRIRDLLERDVSMVSVMQVMLVRWVPPCKRRPLRMCEFNPEGPRTTQYFLGMTLEEMYKLFFGPQIKCPDTTKDAGLSCNRPDTQVSNPMAEHAVLDWGPVNDVPTLQSRIRDLLKRYVSLVKVMQVMLVRRVLPCQHRPLRMWEFNPEGPRTIQQFFGMTIEGMYRLFFGSRIKCSDTTKDAGLNCNRLDTQVSNFATEHVVFIFDTTPI